jgi:hypothetical protein
MKRRARAEGGEGEEEDSRGNGAQRSAHPIKGAGNGDMTTVMRKIKLVLPPPLVHGFFRYRFFLLYLVLSSVFPEQKMAMKNVRANQNGKGGGKWDGE